MRPSNAVQIAKIVSMAVIVSSLIIGGFILASSYIQARAACDQMQALDDMLGKELMLETLQVSQAIVTTHFGAHDLGRNTLIERRMNDAEEHRVWQFDDYVLIV